MGIHRTSMPGRVVRLETNSDSSLSLAQPSIERRIEQFNSLIDAPFADLCKFLRNISKYRVSVLMQSSFNVSF